MIICAIDPGITGALVLLEDGIVTKTMAMPSKTRNGNNVVDSYKLGTFIEQNPIDKVVIEDVHAIFGSGSKSTFNFGRNVGAPESVFDAFGFEIDFITPRSWQVHAWRDIPKLKKKDGSNDTKAKSLMALHKFFPNLDPKLLLRNSRCSVPHDGIVDAILIGKFS